MKRLMFFACASAFCQTIPVEISVNWPPHSLVQYKYGKLPSAFTFGEVIGCNKGNTAITFGEGDVIAALRKSDPNGGLQAFSRQDALSLVGNSQSDSVKNRIFTGVRGGARAVVNAKAAGLLGSGTKTGVALVLGAELIEIALPTVNEVLSLRQLITYNTDGLQSTMQVAAGRCTPPGSVLFAVPTASPKQPVREPAVFTVEIPVQK